MQCTVQRNGFEFILNQYTVQVLPIHYCNSYCFVSYQYIKVVTFLVTQVFYLTILFILLYNALGHRLDTVCTVLTDMVQRKRHMCKFLKQLSVLVLNKHAGLQMSFFFGNFKKLFVFYSASSLGILQKSIVHQ